MMDGHEYLFLKRWGIERQKIYNFIAEMLVFAILGVVLVHIYIKYIH